MATKTKNKPAPRLVTVDSKIRAKYPWIDELAQARKAAAMDERRAKERANGKLLKDSALTYLADEYDKLQRHINELEAEQKKIREMMLLPHWGYTGIEEVESSLGKMLFVPGWSLGMDQGVVERKLSRASWHHHSERVLKPLSLIAASEDTAKHPKELLAITDSLRVAKFQIAIVPPSSRRQKSGQSDTNAPQESGEDDSE